MLVTKQTLNLPIGLALLLSVALGDIRNDPLLIELPNGKLRGRDNGNYYSYESIPYAEPPIGNLRLEPPKPYNRKWPQVLNATKEPVICMQWNQFIPGNNKLIGVEDCLTVSVYKPKYATGRKLPVIGMLHGGAFMFGDVASYGPDPIMRGNQAILVKISYRLGPLGFLSTQDSQISGNFGLKDQRLALQWIKKNIAYFGGDPEKILLIGHSAGGASVHLQMLQPNYKNTFKAAASLSGTAFSPWALIHKARPRAFNLGGIVGCGHAQDSKSLKACLKSKPAEVIVSAVGELVILDYVPFTTFGPVVEPADAPQPFLTQNPKDIIKSGRFLQVPWLVSYTKEDGGYNAAILLQKKPVGGELIDELNARWLEWAPDLLFYRDALKSTKEVDKYSNNLKKTYLGKNTFSIDTYPAVQKMFTDELFKNGIQTSIDLHKKYAKSPIYAYLYDNPADRGAGEELSKREDYNFGTVHIDDFYLIFSGGPRAAPPRRDEEIISKNLVDMLGNFANSASGEIAYDSCAFINNDDKKNVQLLEITRYGCQNKKFKTLP